METISFPEDENITGSWKPVVKKYTLLDILQANINYNIFLTNLLSVLLCRSDALCKGQPPGGVALALLASCSCFLFSL